MNQYLGEDLILVLSPPRSGSTMLQRILGSHSSVQTHPEPHLLTPLAFQGYFHRVERASYNHRVAEKAFREFVDFLPGKESDYLDACRQYCHTLYGRARKVHGKLYFLDKTPNYADTILDFIVRLLPRARMIVLTRHPIAQVASTANTFYSGDFHKAYATRNCLATFVPKIARFLRSAEVPAIHVRYEDLVANPASEVERLLDFLGLPFEPECVNFGKQAHISKTYGDPKIGHHVAPVRDSMESWVVDLAERPDRESLCRREIAKASPADLATFGYPVETLWDPLDALRAGSGVYRGHLPWKLRLHDWQWRSRMTLTEFARRPTVRPKLSYVRGLLDKLVGPDGT